MKNTTPEKPANIDAKAVARPEDLEMTAACQVFQAKFAEISEALNFMGAVNPAAVNQLKLGIIPAAKNLVALYDAYDPPARSYWVAWSRTQADGQKLPIKKAVEDRAAEIRRLFDDNGLYRGIGQLDILKEVVEHDSKIKALQYKIRCLEDRCSELTCGLRNDRLYRDHPLPEDHRLPVAIGHPAVVLAVKLVRSVAKPEVV